MQKAVRVNENQLLYLASKAKCNFAIAGNLYKKSADTAKWQQRWFVLYQNILFYFENESTGRPSGVALLEGCYCERIIVTKRENEKQYYYFSIGFRIEGQRQYDLRADSESECNAWIENIQQASFSRLLQQKEELEQRYLHLLQILDSEKTAKLSLRQQCEDSGAEIAKLKSEIATLKKQNDYTGFYCDMKKIETEDLKKIKKVQSFIRGWLCRRRWRAIVQDYIRSPHAENMRKRNNIVFGMVECEKEYVNQLSTMVSCFYRPLKMAASSKKPPISHEDVNSVFLNCETIYFLHQIFYKGLTARMENWPKLVLGDLFDMLLPMLTIYNEYVRNHHYSLQVLAECKQQPSFSHLLNHYESKVACEGRSLENFLTYPMHQVPRYIITLHDLLAHTPHDHVERESLEFAKNKLEELSRIMHDEVSETENIRKSLSVERMIAEGCDILLDVNQTFVRQGTLIQVLGDKVKSNRSRLGSLSSSKSETRKEGVRQVFLFTNHLLITTRGSSGRLHLAKVGGKISLMDTMLVDDFDSIDDEEGSFYSQGSLSQADYRNLEIKLSVDTKNGPPFNIILLASTQQEKNMWISDISQCLDNLHYNGLLSGSLSESMSSIHLPPSIRTDPRLFKDDIDIRFSRALNSCKVPQIRYASVERLLERLTDLRFLSIDFLNTFLLTYRVFITAETVLQRLQKVYYNPDGMEKLYNLGQCYQGDQMSTGQATTTCSALDLSTSCKSASDSPETAGGYEETMTKRAHPIRRSFRIVSGVEEEEIDNENNENNNNLMLPGTPPLSPCTASHPASPTSPVESDTLLQSPMKRTLSASHSAPNIAELAKAKDGAGPFDEGVFDNPTRGVAAGIVVTSSRQSKRRSSHIPAATAFAVATAGSRNPRDIPLNTSSPHRAVNRFHTMGAVDGRAITKKNQHSVISTAATMRVINILRHWVSKHSQDFITDIKLKNQIIEFVEEIISNVNLVSIEHKAAASILRSMNQLEELNEQGHFDIQEFLTTFVNCKADDKLESLSALELAEQLTFIDHKLFVAVPYNEFLNQAWMKSGKETKAPHILAVTKRFNEVSKLVASEIIQQPSLAARVSSIEKWAAVADICRCMHNYNGVLEITSALMNSSVFRLKRVWDKVPKQVKATLEKLLVLVSSDSRFKNMRDALHKIDPPCIPYLGFYLTDLAFIEDGTPNITDDGLVNFSKMRMIAHTIREIQHFQQTEYKIEPDKKVLSYLLDYSLIMDEDEMYALSLDIEPRQPQVKRQSSKASLSI